MTTGETTTGAAPYTLQIATRWKDNDVYGHVNNVEYYSYIDTVINTYLIAEGGLDIHTGPTIGLCVESHCQYHAPLAFPQVVTAHLSVVKLGRSSVRYEIDLSDGQRVAAHGWFVHVFVDRQSRRPVEIPEHVRTALTRLLVSGAA